MRINIHPIALGIDCCYVIQGEGVIMIDGGAPNKAVDFIKGIARIPIKPEEIQLIVITHEHPDHIGSAREIKDATGARIAMHHLGKDCLEKGRLRQPPSLTMWGRVISKVMAMSAPKQHIPTTDVDIVLEDEGLSLAQYGIPGRVIYTPGHSMGSVSVLLETGDAFVGDLAVNKFPLSLGPRLPSLGEDLVKMKESWKLLLSEGAKMIYPAHGKPFPVSSLRMP